MKVVIITALEVEFLAIRGHLREVEEATYRGTVYEVGKFTSEEHSWSVAVVQVGMGNPNTAAEAERAINHFAPQIAFFVGVAGGLKDVALGDVVAATKVYGYEFGKADQSFKPRPEIAQSSYNLVQRARVVARNGLWQNRILDDSGQKDYKAFVAPMAAGSQVVASAQSPAYKLLRQNYSDALAVEMEGQGFLSALYANPSVSAIVIRGISDLIEDKEAADASGSQQVASHNAAAFAFEMLATMRSSMDSIVESEETKDTPFATAWNVPFLRNPHFTGRESVLRQLDEILGDSEEEEISKTLCIVGLGGVGKSQTVTEFAYRVARNYNIVWWIRADEPTTLAADFSSLGKVIGLPEAMERDQAVLVASVRRWLERSGQRFLLILDNANTASDLALLIPNRGGHVLMTSRTSNWPLAVKRIELDVLESDEAVTFLRNRTGLENEDRARELAEALGCLPLALEQAAAFIEARRLSYDDYLDRFNASRMEMLKRGKPKDYPLPVSSTWELSFEAAAKESSHALGLMKVLAFLGSEAVPLSILGLDDGQATPGVPNLFNDQIALDDAIIALRRYSLLSVDVDGSLTVHRLVQSIAVDRLDETDIEAGVLAGALLIAPTMTIAAGETENGPNPDRLLPHAISLIRHCIGLGLSGSPYWGLAADTGIFLASRGRFLEARWLLERSLNWAEDELGQDDPELTSGYHHLARILKELAEYAAAQTLVERALQIDQNALGLNNIEVVKDRMLLGNILRERGDFIAARAEMERALDIAESILDKDDPLIGSILNDLGLLVRSQGNLLKAQALHQRSLEIHTTCYGDAHPEVGIDLGNLGETLMSLGDFAIAEERFQKALTVHQSWYGYNHPIVAHDLANLGRSLQAQGKYSEATDRFEEAMSLMVGLFGPDHLHVAGQLDNIAQVMWNQGDFTRAKESHRRALAIREAIHGSDHIATAATLASLANVLHSSGETQEAISVLKRALRIHDAAHGTYHPTRAVMLNNLGSMHLAQRQYREAQEFIECALELKIKNGIWRHPDTAKSLCNLGLVMQQLGDLNSAQQRMEQALHLQESLIDASHPDIAVTLNNLASLSYVRGDAEKAEHLYERAFCILEGTLGPQHKSTVKTYKNLTDLLIHHSRVLCDNSDYESARSYLQRALRLHRHMGNSVREQEVLELLRDIESKS